MYCCLLHMRHKRYCSACPTESVTTDVWFSIDYGALPHSLYVYVHDPKQIQMPIKYHVISELPPCAMTWIYY